MNSFDLVAPRYFELWSGAKAGRLQREAVWRHTAHLIHEGARVLDLGCGTGDDALMLASRGAQVIGIDSSPEMVRIARAAGVDARVCAIEDLNRVPGSFDLVWSNFGALNCVEQLPALKSLRPGGHVILCVMSRFCAWETLWHLAHAQAKKATRRWCGESHSSLAPRVFYLTAHAIQTSLAPGFELIARHGIGVAVPPSYVTGISDATMDTLASFDGNLASLPVFRAIGDHQLLIFRKSRKGVD